MSVALTADIEDWQQSTWDRSLPIRERAAENTERLLSILSDAGVTATMFVLGKFAERFPQLVRRMHAQGHEIASHGYGHVEIFNQTREEFRADVSRAKAFLEDTIGARVDGYRAPDFSIVDSSLWALETLAEIGHRYDSSIYPIAHGRYGIVDWPTSPVEVKLSSGASLIELPIGTISVAGRRVPMGGGGYHRLFPWPVIAWSIRRSLTAHHPFVTYVHPYEFDHRDFDSLEFEVPLKTRLHQGLGRRRLQRRFSKMIVTFQTVMARDLASSQTWPALTVETSCAR